MLIVIFVPLVNNVIKVDFQRLVIISVVVHVLMLVLAIVNTAN